ncbi:prolyl oligopeptidase family serine peptidase [Streptococcus moroccensis]|uniref:Peptidase n=1 Tax=Streptococcus moroccensis TaxID=1451356 RepID=A0ABT9YSM8_9STRE|nr:prolyl oligopeptidase family serine peptidase [Streptococcus moroccensis]MDQ0222724.1 putative peptidase [Streptococcus moroccensis]
MKKTLKYLLAATAILGLVACSQASKKETSKVTIKDAKIEVTGYEWGPSVSALVVELDQEVSDVTAEDISVKTLGVDRQVTAVYLSDEKGQKVDVSSKYVALDLEVTYSFASPDNASPFNFNLDTMMNEWATEYPIEISGLTVAGKILDYSTDAINKRIMNDTDAFNVRGQHQGHYNNPLTGNSEELILQYAAYEPEHLKETVAKSPLVIWLHGQGEGGTDIDITLLGNEVTALTRDDIQSYYSATGDEAEKGAYVLAVQTPTYWMDEGDGTNGAGAGKSRYTEALMAAIEAYVASNPDVDTNRIYLGGCSNGGYMTMNMAIEYPDYFAAAYPLAEAYSFYDYQRNPDGTYAKEEASDGTTASFIPNGQIFVTEEKLATLKNLPIWFVMSADDEVVLPDRYVLPTYQALLQAGADNAWLSYYETVQGKDIPENQYMGHWSWIYFFNNQVTGVQDTEAVKAASDVASAYQPSNASFGGNSQASYSNIFEWMNAQSK